MESEHQDGCMNPHSCFSKAKALIGTLPPKWDLRTGAKDEQPEVDPDEEWIMFERLMVTEGNIAEIFHIFTSGEASNILRWHLTLPQNTRS